jgi:beta-lactam-binding protein with PASTA domain
MFKRTVFYFIALVFLAAIRANGVDATMYYYNIPEVRGMSRADAEKALKAKKYVTDVIFSEVEAKNYNELGKCLGSDPFGTIILAEEKRFPVTVKIASKGSFVPFTLLMPEPQAVEAVNKAGYVPKVEYYSEENTGMVGKVKATAPAPYLNLAKGGTVVLHVGAAGYPMPDFIGKNAIGATQTIQQLNSLKKLNLKGAVSQGKTTNNPQDDQKVYEQSPAPGTILKNGNEIKLTAYKYVKPGTILMPDLIGKPEKTAVETLTRAGLKVDITYKPSPRQINLRNLVMEQSVKAGSETSGPVVLTVGR